MPLLVVALLVCVVHLATGIGAWLDVGLLADDREMIGAAILRHRGDWTLASAFFPEPTADAARALYRPFVDLLFWLEQPYFGIDAFGYHVVNSAMHCATAVLWYSLVRRWSASIAAGLATAVLFVAWPGHSEATHWIAARVTLQSVFLLSISLWLHEVACTRVAAGWRWFLLVLAALFACCATGSKESAVFLGPLAAIVSWHRSPGLREAILRTLPMAVAMFGWLWWRKVCLGTWGSGTHYGWRLHRVGSESCSDWLSAMLAPVHVDYLSGGWWWGVCVLQVALLLVALAALRFAAARLALAVGGALLAFGYLAGIGLEKLHVDTLQNIRYSYEPALGLCAMLGVAIASLPTRVRGALLAVMVLVYAIVLDGNRESWLRASRVYEQMHAAVIEQARTTQQPVRVLDGPGVYDGAFAYLNGFTEFLFWQQTAEPGINLRGSVSSRQQWRAVLAQLAQAAAAKKPMRASVVQWHDGSLQPFELDMQWPSQLVEGVDVLYARVARQRPFWGSRVPVDVMLQTQQPLTLRCAIVGGSSGEDVRVEASELPQTVRLWLPMVRSPGMDQADVVLWALLDQSHWSLPLGGVRPVLR